MSSGEYAAIPFLLISRMTIHISAVQHASNLDDSLHGFELIEPQTGDSFDISSLRFNGWALAKRGSVKSLQLMNGSVVWKSIPVSRSSPQASQALPDAKGKGSCGFRGRLGTIGLPREFQIDIYAVLQNSQRVFCASVCSTREPLKTSHSPRFHPIILTSLARTGTTRMMQTLGLHPEIALNGKYPYESRPGCYWIHMLKVLAEPSDGRNTFEANLGVLPSCPMNSESISQQPMIQDWFGNDYVSRLAEFAQQNIDQLYSRIADQNGRLATACYFAEKSLPCHLQWIAQELYPLGKEIVLIRDFRDMICSMIAFNNKRGFATFGRESVESDADFIRLKQLDVIKLMDVVRARGDHVMCVRYEDLVLDSANTLRRIFEYLGIARDDQTIASLMRDHETASKSLDFHRTTQNGASSVGRWKRDLQPRMQALCGEMFGDLLAEAGYDY